MTIGVFFLAHLYRLSDPPNGYHHWRETDTAAVMLNYYQEGMNFFEPRINQRGATSGITGMELPLLQYIGAVLYHVTGPSHAAARMLTVIAACTCLWLFFRSATFFSNELEAALATWAVAFSPLFLFYSHKIMPDIWMLTLWMASIYMYLCFQRNGRPRSWIGSAACLMLGAGIKPLCLSIYLPYLFLLVKGKGENRLRNIILFGMYVAFTLGPVFLWMQYARQLQQSSGLYTYYLGHNLANFHEYLLSSQFFKKLLLQWPSELWIGWVMLPAFLYGLSYTARNRSHSFFFVWILSTYIVFVVTALKSSSHDYYTIIIVSPLAVVTGAGLYRLYTRGHWRRVVALALVIVAPIGALLRIHQRLGPTDDYYAIRAAAGKIIPEDTLVAVEDDTPAIRLYQLNRRGWPLRSGVRYDEVAVLVRQGARFLIVEQPLDTAEGRWDNVLFTEPIEFGPLLCYRTKNGN
ncbi:MAG TPA: glycosyltransferase family 39 protein [Candidatus Deferrimicrobium sp.]|nr:glycosyltransferase family 39 protein [Candidatus Deferrimicrobium sp.]